MGKVNLMLFALIALVFSSNAQSSEWVTDKMHSHIGFNIAHMGISLVAGRFDDFSGKFSISNEKDLSTGQVQIDIKVNSINTDVLPRDEDLRSPNFFDMVKYPEIKYVSTKIERSVGDTYRITGNLTMHGVTKPVALDVVYLGQAYEPQMKVQKAGFIVKGVINRDDFGITYNAMLPSGAPMIGREVFLNISFEFIKK